MSVPGNDNQGKSGAVGLTPSEVDAAAAAIVCWQDSQTGRTQMLYRTFGKTGISVSEVGFGAWAMWYAGKPELETDS